MSTFKRLTLALITLVVCSSAIAADTDLTGMWTGNYAYPDGGPAAVNFALFLVRAENGYIGCIVETNTFGKERKDPYLHADVVGAKYNQDARTFNFTKKYDGTDGISTTADYSGKFSADGTKIDGSWNIGSASGTFTMTKSANTKSGRFSGGVWTGKYRYPEGELASPREPVPFSMIIIHNGDRLWGYVHEAKTFGEGDAPRLHAALDGEFDATTKKIKFTKTYDGTAGDRHAVDYEGAVADHGTMKGTWTIENSSGTFTAELDRSPKRDEDK